MCRPNGFVWFQMPRAVVCRRIGEGGWAVPGPTPSTAHCALRGSRQNPGAVRAEAEPILPNVDRGEHASPHARSTPLRRLDNDGSPRQR